MNADDFDSEKQAKNDREIARSEKPPIKAVAKQTLAEFKSDDVPEIAAGVAYHAIFAIPPMIFFLISLAAIVNNVTSVPVAEQLTDMINRSAPGETRLLLRSLVDGAIEQVGGGVASLGFITALLIALWSGSNGIGTVIKAFNRAYDVEEDRPFIKQKAVALGLTVLCGVLIILAFASFVFGGQIGNAVAGWLNLSSQFELVWNILRWPLAIIFIMFLLAVLYYLGPNVEQSFRWISPGSIVATLLWLAIVVGFKVYLSFSNPGSAYGAVGSVVVLLFFLYVTSIAFIIGAELNAVLQRHFDPETVKDLAQNPDKVKSKEDVDQARRRAAQLDQREGTSVAATAPRSRHDAKKPGFGARIASGAGSLFLAAVIARFSRPRSKS